MVRVALHPTPTPHLLINQIMLNICIPSIAPLANSDALPRFYEIVHVKINDYTSRGLMQGINMEKSSQGCYKAIQIGFCDSYHNKIINIQNRLPYSKVVYPAIIVLFHV